MNIRHSKENEQRVLCCLIGSPEINHLYFDRIAKDDFFFKASRDLFTILRESYEHDEPVEIDILIDKMKKLNHSDALEFVSATFYCQAMTFHLDQYVNELNDSGKQRRLIKVCEEIGIELSENEKPMDDIIASAIEKISDVGLVEKDMQVKEYSELSKQASNKILDVYDGKESSLGYKTGFIGLDHFTNLGRKEIIIIGARPGMGKTSLAGCLAMNLKHHGINSYIVSMEMDSHDFIERLIYTDLGSNKYNLKKLDRQQLKDALAAIDEKESKSPGKIWFDCIDRAWTGIKRRIRIAVKNHGAHVVMIDYMQLIKISDAKISGAKIWSRENEVAALSAEMKALAMELDIPIVILSQLNRLADGKKPTSANLRESGAIEQDADQIWLLHDDGVKPNTRGAFKPTKVYLLVSKNRRGRTGTVDLLFDPELTKFTDFSFNYLDPEE